MDEKEVTEGVETTSEVTDDVQLSEAEESLDTAEPAQQKEQNPSGSAETFEESSEEPRNPSQMAIDFIHFFICHYQQRFFHRRTNILNFIWWCGNNKL